MKILPYTQLLGRYFKGPIPILAAGAIMCSIVPARLMGESQETEAPTSSTTPRSGKVPVWQAKLPSFDSSNYNQSVEALLSTYEKSVGHPLAPGAKGRVGLKVYTDSGPELATPAALVYAVISALQNRGFESGNIFLVGLSKDRLLQAGFLPSAAAGNFLFAGQPVYVIESGQCAKDGWYYDSPVPGKLDTSSGKDAKVLPGKSDLAARLFLDADFWIDLPVYTDDPALGVNGALANATLWNATNTARFFSSPAMAPAAVAEMGAIPELHSTWILTLASLQTYEYSGGPAYNSRYTVSEPYVWLSTDPVMMDSLMRDRINGMRRKNGLAPISDEIHTMEDAETLGLGSADVGHANLVTIKY